MRFSVIFAAAFAAVVYAADNAFTLNSGFSASAGDSAELTWDPTTKGTVTLTLRSGSSGDLDKGTVIASGIPNSGKYTWNVPSSVSKGSNYAIEISSDSSDATNYSAFFTIDSDVTGSTTTAESSSSATKSASHSGYPTTSYSNHSTTSTKKSHSATGKATLTTTTEEPTKTTSAEGGETSAPTGAAVINNGAPMLALAIAGAVVAF